MTRRKLLGCGGRYLGKTVRVSARVLWWIVKYAWSLFVLLVVGPTATPRKQRDPGQPLIIHNHRYYGGRTRAVRKRSKLGDH